MKFNSIFFAVLFLLTGIASSWGFSITRDLRIESSPAGATVFLNGVDSGKTPLNVPKYTIKSETGLEVTVKKDGYEQQSQKFTYDQAKAATKDRAPWKFANDLVEVRRSVSVAITSTVPGANIFVNDQLVGLTPTNHTLVFSRAGKDGKWNDYVVSVEKANYSKDSKPVTFEMTRPDPPNDLTLAFSIAELRRDVPFEVYANTPEASVTVSGKPAVKTPSNIALPLKTTLVYERPTGAAPWPELKIEVQKEGFEYRVPDGLPLFVYSQALSIAAAAKGSLKLDAFFPARYVLTPIRMFEVEKERTTILITNIYSKVDRSERGSTPIPFRTSSTDGPLVLSRISCSPDRIDQIAFSMPVRQQSDGKGGEKIVGANIFLMTGAVTTQMTEGEQFDIDPFITTDGKWIYFSSDRDGVRCIWRKPMSGKAIVQRITGVVRAVDTEPAVAPDGQKVAYTSRSPNAPPGTPSSIWIANWDGTLPSQIRAGHSPSWSPDGKKLAFISKNKIWTVEADGNQPTQLTQGASEEMFPIWTPFGKHLIYASNDSRNDLGLKHFDICMVSVDGVNPIKLTENGSFDNAPAVSYDGKLLYFFSNRGAQRNGDEFLQILRLDMPGD
jgi:hypothetical protein